MQNRFITYLFLSIDQINKIYERKTSANFEQRERSANPKYKTKCHN